MSLGVAVFLIDARVVPGGVTGLSMAFHYLLGGKVSVGVLMWIMNLPLFIWGVIELGRTFGFRTFWGFSVNSFCIDLFRGDIVKSIRLQDTSTIQYLMEKDFFFLILIGAIFIGVGLGVIFKFKGTTAGSDIVAAVAKKRLRAKPGIVIIITDFFVICVAGIVLHVKGLSPDKPVMLLMLYSFMLLVVSSQLIDIIIFGFDYAKSAFIISDKHEEIADCIVHRMGRGATAFHGRGLYRNIERDILFTVVNRREIYRLVGIVKDIDPDAFVIINRVHEVLGAGFMARGEVDVNKLKLPLKKHGLPDKCT